jgi:cytidyltransferase-like protein
MEKNMLTDEHIFNYKKYKYASEDNTFLTKIYYKMWNNVEYLIPKNLHPNLITLMGFIFVLLGYLLRNQPYGNLYMGLCIFIYMNCDGLDGIHARRIKQTSIIGEYFDHLVDLSNVGFMANALMEQFGVNSLLSKNIMISGLSIIFMIPHYEAIYSGKIIFKGVSDVSLFLTVAIIIFMFDLTLPNFSFKDNFFMISGLLMTIYSFYWLYQIIITNYINTKNIEFKLPIVLVVYYTLKNIFNFLSPSNFFILSSISDTLLLLGIINYKIFKMSINKSILLIPFIYYINPLIATVFVLYQVINFIYEMSSQLKINLFQVVKRKPRVYCCGVFDLCHIGHMLLFEKISKSFDEQIELIVGVHSDLSCSDYKRPPILNEKLRYETVLHCKHVERVYKNAPLITTKEFIIKNNIDCVIIGEEYKNKKDKYWYPGAFDLSIYKYISRCELISTSDIIKKIKSDY